MYFNPLLTFIPIHLYPESTRTMFITNFKKPIFTLFIMILAGVSILTGLGGLTLSNGQAAPLVQTPACFPTADYPDLRHGNSPLGDNFYGDHKIDFDGDGRTDVFTVDNGVFKFSSGAAQPWQILRSGNYPIEDLRFGDFDDDGITDIFRLSGSRFVYSSGGVGDWVILQNPNILLEDLRVGNFDDDPRSDIYYRSSGGVWMYSSAGSGPFTATGQTSLQPIENFRFADFDGNGKTDVFTIDNTLGTFYISYDAATAFIPVFSETSTSLDEARFGQFDDQPGADVFLEINGNWMMSSSSTTPLVTIANAGMPLDQLRIGDFDGNGRSDLFTIASNYRWQVASAPNYIFETFPPPNIQTSTGLLTCIADDAETFQYSYSPSISGNGTRIAFGSNADFLGTGDVNGFEVWYYDELTQKLARVTTGTNATSVESLSPVISADGNTIVFHSDADLLNQGNMKGQDIWLYDVQDSELNRITKIDETGRKAYHVDVDGNGRRIVFVSNADLLDQGIPSTQYELWMYDTQTQNLNRLTTASGVDRGSFNPTISKDGSKIVFTSDSDFLGQGGIPDNKYELWSYDIVTGNLSRLTNIYPDREISPPSINGDGTGVVFSSDADFLGEGIPYGHYEIWHLSLVTGNMTRITEGALNRNSYYPYISADGQRIVFESFADLLNEGRPYGRREIWHYDLTSSMFSRLTSSQIGEDNYEPVISDDGRKVAFASDADFSGHGPNANDYSIWLLDLAEMSGDFNSYLPFVFK